MNPLSSAFTLTATVESRKWENPAVSRRSRDETYRPYLCTRHYHQRIIKRIVNDKILGVPKCGKMKVYS
jgi:hypothetical protein